MKDSIRENKRYYCDFCAVFIIQKEIKLKYVMECGDCCRIFKTEDYHNKRCFYCQSPNVNTMTEYVCPYCTSGNIYVYYSCSVCNRQFDFEEEAESCNHNRQFDVKEETETYKYNLEKRVNNFIEDLRDLMSVHNLYIYEQDHIVLLGDKHFPHHGGILKKELGKSVLEQMRIHAKSDFNL